MLRDYDGSVIRWMTCVERGSHRFNQGNVCVDCGVAGRGPTVTTVRGGVTPRRKKEQR
jgi:hypothetical protein